MTREDASPESHTVQIGPPTVDDGAALWRLVRDSQRLDLNSSYSYLLWCRDFAATSAVARDDGGGVCGFVTGYRRPSARDTLVVWQVAVDATRRGEGLAGRMLDHLVARLAPHGVRVLETTITEDNAPSIALFTGFARRHGAGLERRVLFRAEHFPDGHDEEVLFEIAPLPNVADGLPQSSST